MNDREAYITAATLLKKHGELAWLHATTKAETLLEQGDVKRPAGLAEDHSCNR